MDKVEKNPDVAPIPNTQQEYAKFKKTYSLLSAISQIQQYAMMERAGQAIPSEFLTLNGKFQFMHSGFGSAFKESLYFTFLFIIFIPVLSDPILKVHLENIFLLPILFNNWLIKGTICFPIIASLTICIFSIKYRIGDLSKTAIDYLLWGRLFSYLFKGFLLFFLILKFNEYLTVEKIVNFSAMITFNSPTQYSVTRVLYAIKNSLPYAAFETLYVFLAAAATPVFTVWITALFKALFNRKDDDDI